MGQKPLFYATLEDGLVFASTINSVLQWPQVPRRVPRQQIALYLTMGFLPPPQTIYRDISQLMPGHWLRLRRDVLDGGRYWSPQSPTQSATPPNSPMMSPSGLPRREPSPTDIRATLTGAIQSQLIADVPIACFLSGGIDSSIIATLMQQAIREADGNRIHTVSVGFTDASFD